jgi:hypothetical protein
MYDNNAKSGNVAAIATEQKQLESLCNQMERQIAALGEGVARIHGFKNRLLNPRPQGVGEKGPQTPPAQSIEGRLHDLVCRANALSEILNDACNELDRAA